jgi:hypothetical protein
MKNNIESIKKKITINNPEAIFWNDCDDAIIGHTEDYRFVYSIEKLYEVFVNQGMTYEDSIEWVNYNILNAYVGEFTPLHIYES